MKRLIGRSAAMLAVALVCSGNLVAQDEKINVKLEYSVNGGDSFSTEAPVVKVGGSVLVRVSGTVDDEKAVRVTLFTLLYSTEGDFASANCGKQPNRWGVSGWYQRLQKYYQFIKKPGSSFEFVYKLDLGARKEGTMGTSVKYDKVKKNYVAAPLPGLEAKAPGEYKFSIRVYYRPKGAPSVVKEIPFAVKVQAP